MTRQSRDEIKEKERENAALSEAQSRDEIKKKRQN